ncbi:MAG: HD family phosphohydrolase [Nostocaceae cyanobacterium]|nr:HD family phosphohydrolase [Nostocaceae cyanobacterium]
MKTLPLLQSLTQQLTHWRRRHQALRRLRQSRNRTSKAGKQPAKVNPTYAKFYRRTGQNRSPAMFVIAVVSLTGVMGHRLYNQPKLKVGTVAPQTIKAPKSDRIEDKKQTQANREAASTKSLPILMLDAGVNEKIEQNLQKILHQGSEIRGVAGAFPFGETVVLSLQSQRYLRSCSETEWLALLKVLQDNPQQNYRLPTANFILKQETPEFSQALSELQAYRITSSFQNLSTLMGNISQIREKYAQADRKLVKLNNELPNAVYDNSLLNLSDEDWLKTQTGIHTSATRILAQGIPAGLPKEILQDAVNLHLESLVPKEAEPLASKMLLSVFQPNLKKDVEQTRIQAAKAAAAVTPVMVDVKQGEVIVHQGQEITEWDFVVLDHYGLSRREINGRGLLLLGIAVTGAVGVFVFVERQTKVRLRQRDCLLVLLLTLSTPLLVTMGVPYTAWSAIALLLGSFYGSTLGVTVVGLLMVLLPISLEIGWLHILAGAAGGILGSWMAGKLRSREELALLGIAIGLTEGGVYLLINLLISAASGSISYTVLQEAALFSLSGLAWSIVALGLSPYLEQLFDLVTSIRLSELANPNRPLLQKLATYTPGTFQHTLFVATLAEAAAKALGCNVELVRSGTLYHDIGKMHDPLGFIENQMGGPNKHDTDIKDPWKSAEIIKKHVTQGLVIARKYRLPTAIQAFIPEHQGTMLIAYFYHQAEKIAQQEPSIQINEADFRYDGPIPQSRETGIVMLADSCEAALRSLKDATPEQALAMVNNILRARWQDKQMIDCGLTREEMKKIAEIFVDVWQQFHHKRIAYPKIIGNR